MILTIAIGGVLNSIVVSSNEGMPAIGTITAYGRWVPINQGTKFLWLSDIIRAGWFTLSFGDMFIITGIIIGMTTVWIAMQKARKVFPLLVANVIGIAISRSLPDDIISTLLFTTAASVSLLAMYFKQREALEIEN